jgi:hypothetical protein
MVGAIGRMEAIEAALPASDGLAVFNHMYLGITRDVERNVGLGFFADGAFMARLDVVFANRYFDAVDSLSTSPTDLPTAWAPLLERRGDAGIEPIQFALAGMNAHINYDLPASVVATCSELGRDPDGGAIHGDYQKVDALLAGAEQAVRQSFEAGLVLSADRHLQAVANVVSNWSITTARDVAWDTARALWAIRGIGFAEDMLLTSLGHTVGMAGWGLLAAV